METLGLDCASENCLSLFFAAENLCHIQVRQEKSRLAAELLQIMAFGRDHSPACSQSVVDDRNSELEGCSA